jgi:hypothetical protein
MKKPEIDVGFLWLKNSEEFLNMNKLNKIEKMRIKKNKRNLLLSQKKGQLAIFIILAIAIVAILIFILYKPIQTFIKGSDPSTEIKKCSEDALKEAINLIEIQGGTINHENFVNYEDSKIEYACYTNEYYLPCKNTNLLMISSMQKEIETYVLPAIKDCFTKVKNNLNSKGQEASFSKVDVKVELVPSSANILISSDLKVEREQARNYGEISTSISSGIYDLAIISSSIINWEARYGDSESTIYMSIYPNIKVEKKRYGENKIYIITDRISNDKFMFAVRGGVFPAGYGIMSVI